MAAVFAPADVAPKEVELIMRFCPQSDIDAFELAYILTKVSPLNGDILVMPSKWKLEAEQIKRHFKPA